MRSFMVTLFGVTVSLLQACSLIVQVNNIDPNQPLTLSPGTGMIVGSVTAPRVGHYWEVSHFRYRKPGDSKSGVLESASPTADFLWMKDRPIEPGGTGPDPGLEAQLGRLFAVELPAGTYEIYQLDTPGSLLIHMQPVRFEVRAGEIRYLGNLHVRYCLNAPDGRPHRGYVKRGIPSVRNEAPRDLPMLARKFPALTGANIIPAIIDANAWRGLEQSNCPN